MFRFLKHHRWRILVAAGGTLALAACALVLLLPRLNRYLASEAFRAELDKETAKGLHLSTGRYEPIRRISFMSATTDGFKGEGGRKAITAISTGDVTAKFNPWGIFFRRWQLDNVWIKSGEVKIQTYVPHPEPELPKPWYAILLPDRVYLKQLVCERTDVTWRFREQKAGFFATRLLVSPHGCDFEYRATGGTFKMALIPDFTLDGTHVLITKELLSVYNLDLATGEGGHGTLHVQGKAGLREDRSVDAYAQLEKLPLGAWLPGSWRDRVSGLASGKVHWTGKNTKMETSSGDGSLRVERASISGLPLLEQLVTLTGKESLHRLDLTECALEMKWNFPKIEITDIAIEEEGKLRLEGSLIINHRTISGAIRLGAAREYLDWLPKAEEIFTLRQKGYFWTTIRLSGTIDHPEEDLSLRIKTVLKQSPGTFLEVFFRQIGEWFEKTFESE
jgi:hypothetical protein